MNSNRKEITLLRKTLPFCTKLFSILPNQKRSFAWKNHLICFGFSSLSLFWKPAFRHGGFILVDDMGYRATRPFGTTNITTLTLTNWIVKVSNSLGISSCRSMIHPSAS